MFMDMISSNFLKVIFLTVSTNENTPNIRIGHKIIVNKYFQPVKLSHLNRLTKRYSDKAGCK